MTRGRDLSVADVKEGARRLWDEFDSGAVQIAERRVLECPEGSFDRRWWSAMAAELPRQLGG